MTMMISKFHRLIQSRLLWGAFLVIIVFSFVIWGMVWPSDLDKAEQANAAGTLDGAPVSHAEFRSAYLSTYLARALALGREIDSTPETDAVLRRLSWQRLATLREAARLGIGATDDELVGTIRSNFADTNRVYNPQQYQAFLQNVVRPMGFTAGQFEQHIREEIAIKKLGSLIGRQAHVTPLEIRRTFDTLLDKFAVEYAVLRPDVVADRPETTEADARKLYDENPAAFTLPEQCEVSYVAFPVAEQADEEAEISEDDVLDYYELHIEDFTTTETDTNGQPRETVADLDDVRTNVVAALRREAAVAKADSAAAEFSFKAIPDRDGTIPDFAEEAKKSGREAKKLAPFSRYDLPLEDAGAAFVAAAFELEPNAFDRVSAPVAGTENVYVIYLEKKIDSRVPGFDEAKESVLKAARQRAMADALSAKAGAVKDAAEAGLAAGKSFSKSIAEFGLKTETAEPFSGLSGSSSTNEIVQALVQSVVAYNQGEIADPIPVADGLIVAYLAERTPGEVSDFDAYRDEIAAAVRNRRAQTLFTEWQAALLAPERFVDLQRPEAAADDLEEGADEDAEDAPPPPISDEDRQFL